MKTIKDEFITWLRFANAGMLESGNVWCLNHMVKNMPERLPIIEIGSFCGLSTNVIMHLCRKHRRSNPLFCSDRWIFEGAEEGGPIGDSDLTHDSYREFVKDSFKRNIRFFSKKLPFAIEVCSDDFFDLWRKETEVQDVFERPVQLGGTIGAAYIDGNHTPKQCRKDFDNCHRHLAKGGFILFDDSGAKAPFGLYPFMQELMKRGDYECVIENPNLLFRKKG